MDYTNILYAVIALLVALADAFLIPLIKAKIDAAKLAKILSYVKIAVEAAEKLFISEEEAGEKKKQYVLEYLQKKGIKFDEETIDNAIEAAVLEMEQSLLNEQK